MYDNLCMTDSTNHLLSDVIVEPWISASYKAFLIQGDSSP